MIEVKASKRVKSSTVKGRETVFNALQKAVANGFSAGLTIAEERALKQLLVLASAAAGKKSYWVSGQEKEILFK